METPREAYERRKAARSEGPKSPLKRLWSAKSRGFSVLKDVVTFTIAVAAFTLSLPNVIRQTDDLRVAITSKPYLEVDLSKNEANLSSDRLGFVFINAGNIATAITGVEYIIEPIGSISERPEKVGEHWYSRRYGCRGTAFVSNEVIVIKEKEIVSREIRLQPREIDKGKTTDEQKRSFKIYRGPDEDYDVAICLVFTIASPTGVAEEAIEVDRQAFHVRGNGGGGGGGPIPPYIIHQKSTFFFRF